MAGFQQASGNAPRPPPVPRADEIALFADIDGTLVEFAATPEAVEPDAKLPTLLRELHAMLDGAFALLSGRSLAQIDTLLHLPSLPVAAQHGAELRDADGRVARLVEDDARPLDPARAALAGLLAQAPGLRLEDKGIALALHYRNAPQAARAARQFADVALASVGPGFELQRGDFVLELKSSRIDKGRALATLMTQVPFRSRVPWMLGDDYADEYAIAMAQSLDGVGVIVGSRQPSVARYALADVAAAHNWLDRLAQQAARRRGAA